MAADMIKISAFQGRCDNDFDKNLKKVHEVIDKGGQEGSDFLCFPEGYLSNWIPGNAAPLDDPRVLELIKYTDRYDMVVIVGLSEEESGKLFNTALILYRGKMLGKYRKTMLIESEKKVFASDSKAEFQRIKVNQVFYCQGIAGHRARTYRLF